MVRLTKRAVTEAHRLQADNGQWKNKGLRLWISGKNCEGLLYGVTFDRPDPKDRIVVQGGIAVLIDRDTARYVEGASIDYVDDERGQGFLVENPRAKEFAGKFYLKRDPLGRDQKATQADS